MTWLFYLALPKASECDPPVYSRLRNGGSVLTASCQSLMCLSLLVWASIKYTQQRTRPSSVFVCLLMLVLICTRNACLAGLATLSLEQT